MKAYKDSIINVHNEFQYRESIEWTNTWISDADQRRNQSKRYLLIGDSTSRMVRSTLERVAGCPVDMIGTSSALYDELFVKLIDGFFKDNLYHYDIAFVQLGHHGLRPVGGGVYGTYLLNDYEDFEYDMRMFLSYLSQHTDRIIVESIFDSVVPSHFRGKKLYLLLRQKIPFLRRLQLLHEQKDERLNSIKHRKNDILMGLCNAMNISFLDINEFMNHLNFIHEDHIHFEKAAKIVIAKKMIDFIQ